MSNPVKSITDATFNEVVTEKARIVLVDFWADWCGPCKALAPVLSDVAEEYADTDVSICKINADENKESAERCGVRGLPTMILFMSGEEKERIVGLTSKTRLVELLDRHLEG